MKESSLLLSFVSCGQVRGRARSARVEGVRGKGKGDAGDAAKVKGRTDSSMEKCILRLFALVSWLCWLVGLSAFGLSRCSGKNSRKREAVMGLYRLAVIYIPVHWLTCV